MNRKEHLFLKLMEECAEVQQRVSKLLQFGPDEVQNGQIQTNMERLRFEINDVIAVIRLLEDTGNLICNGPFVLGNHEVAKRAKTEKYLKLSESLGLVVDKDNDSC